MSDAAPSPVKRFLIALGASRYPSGHFGDLPKTPEELEKIDDLFRGLGYTRVLDDPRVSLDAPAAVIREQVSDFFANKDRRQDEVVTFYFTGHGASVKSTHYLWPSGGDRDNPSRTAIAADELAKWFFEGENPRPESLLIILDCCYAEEGSAILAAALTAIRLRTFRADDTGVYILAASRATETAAPGALAAALEVAVNDPAFGGPNQAYLNLDYLLSRIQEALGTGQKAVIDSCARKGQALHLPNPRYSPHFVGANLEEAEARRRASMEHFDPKARGVGSPAEPGFFFTGRRKALLELVKVLKFSTKDTRMRVVTGSPGSGKSAVLGRLVILSDPVERERFEESLTPEDPAPRIGDVDCHLHLRRLAFGDAWSRLAKNARVDADSCHAFITSIEKSKKPFRVVVDALDEALAPREISENLLQPLAALDNVQMIVGTRSLEIDHLGSDLVKIDLDDPDYYERRDLVQYVENRLSTNAGYVDQSEVTREIAEAVAERARHSFLVASIVGRKLAQSDTVLDTSVPGWKARLPDSTDKAFEEDLTRFGADAERARDLLRPLAYAQGRGFPQEYFWCQLASRLSGRTYTNDDVEWLKKAAAFYITSVTDDGISVYRLYHEALAEQLRSSRNEADDETAIVEILTHSVPQEADHRLNWSRAHHYVKSYLAVHARRAARLGSLLDDVGYIVNASPTNLLEEIFRTPSARIHRAGRLYGFAAHRFRLNSDAGERASLLTMVAQEDRDDSLAVRFGHFIESKDWTPLWSQAIQRSPHRVLSKFFGRMRCITMGEVDGKPVVAGGGDSKEVYLWDAGTGDSLVQPMKGHTDIVKSIAIGVLDGAPVVISGGFDASIRVWDARKGDQLRELVGHEQSVNGVVSTTIGGVPAVVSCSSDKTIRIWDLTTGKQRGESIVGHKESVTSIALCTFKGAHGVVSGSEDGTARIWDLRTGRQRKRLQAFPDRTGVPRGPFSRPYVRTVACGNVGGELIVVAAGHGESVVVWNVKSNSVSRIPIEQPKYGVDSVRIMDLDDTPVVVAGCGDSTIRMWDIPVGAPYGGPLVGHVGPVWAVSTGSLDGTPVIVSAGSDDTVRVWDARNQSVQIAQQVDYSRRVTSFAVRELDQRRIIVSGDAGGAVRMWDAETGKASATPRIDDGIRVNDLVVGDLGEVPVVVTGYPSGTCRVFDARSGEALTTFVSGSDGGVSEIALITVDESVIAAFCDYDPCVHFWNLTASELHAPPTEGHEGSVTCVAAGFVNDEPVAVSGGSDRTLRIWDVKTGKPRGEPMLGHTNDVSCVALGDVDGVLIIVSGDYDNVIRTWDARSGRGRDMRLLGHSAPVNSIALGLVDQLPVAVSGGKDNSARVWSLRSGACLLRIDFDDEAQRVCIDKNVIFVSRGNGLTAIRLPSDVGEHRPPR